ncbi:ATP-binding protein [Kingella negevensis]|uniref:ATP-binding protein n=1 Tax=Kingella negevensis TaxID=1522312 RepID=UPI0025429A85|nr:ATP-binding protein [Kingella negevensis]WII92605.1 ATP-binding protein [Kingella negevensis]
MKDPLYYPRTELATALLSSLKSGISHAFTLFAPRRMGKTHFLTNDIAPAAEKDGFNVFYFSFMDSKDNANPVQFFHETLHQFALGTRTTNGVKTLFGSFKKIDVLGVGIERETQKQELPNISEIINYIAADNKPTLLLLDEVQELARIPKTENTIKSLRTGLDINQSRVKTIFTGSSTNGLRTMFNDIKAPFFHFSHALNFPTLGKDFTDFLANIYQERTSKEIDKQELYAVFEQLDKSPLYIRAIIQDMIINPELSLNEAAQICKEQRQDNSNIPLQWQELSAIERLALKAIATRQGSLYSEAFRQYAAQMLGIETALYIRAIIQDMIINPELSLNEAAQICKEQRQDNSNIPLQWQELSAIERLALKAIATRQGSLYSEAFRQYAAQMLGIETALKVSTVQSAIRKLERKDLITKDSNNKLKINSPLWQTWLNENMD